MPKLPRIHLTKINAALAHRCSYFTALADTKRTIR
jgi:hypothetical protein